MSKFLIFVPKTTHLTYITLSNSDLYPGALRKCLQAFGEMRKKEYNKFGRYFFLLYIYSPPMSILHCYVNKEYVYQHALKHTS